MLGDSQACHGPHVRLQRRAQSQQQVTSRPGAAVSSSQLAAALLEQVHGAVRGAGREQELRAGGARPSIGCTAACVPPHLADAAGPRVDPSDLSLKQHYFVLIRRKQVSTHNAPIAMLACPFGKLQGRQQIEECCNRLRGKCLCRGLSGSKAPAQVKSVTG